MHVVTAQWPTEQRHLVCAACSLVSFSSVSIPDDRVRLSTVLGLVLPEMELRALRIPVTECPAYKT